MEAFVETVADARAAQRLTAALHRHRQFRAFKDTLLDFPDIRSAWFTFEQACQRRRADQWFNDEGIKVEWT
jgi:Uncharacterised protein family (UPF0158)